MGNVARRFAVFGEILREYIITRDGTVHLDLLGGSAIYTALGARLWEAAPLPVAVLAQSFPEDLLAQLTEAGIPADGLLRIPSSDSHLSFYAYAEDGRRTDASPTHHFLKTGTPLPKQLLGYAPRTGLPPASLAALLQHDQDERFRSMLSGLSSAHVCPMGYASQAILVSRLRELGFRCLTLDPHPSFLHPWLREGFGALVNGLDALLLAEEEALQFFRPAKPSTWEMAEQLAAFGCRYVVLKLGARGAALWDGFTARRWHIPAYPTTERDPTGAGDAFAGGFLVGLATTHDPLEAALMGTVSASLAIERSGALEVLASLPGLVEARRTAIRSLVKSI